MISNKISRVIINAFLGIVLCVCLLGCSGLEALNTFKDLGGDTTKVSSDDAGEALDRITVYNVDGEEVTSSESVISMMEEEDDEISGADLAALNNNLFEDDYAEYAYSKLSPDEEKIYREIYATLSDLKENVVLSTVDTEVIDRCFKAVMIDHPEIFYVTGYSMNKYSIGDVIKKISFTGTYTMDASAVDDKKTVIEEYVGRCLSGIPQDASDYDKVKYVYEYLIKDNTYDLEVENNQNLLSICENHRTVCQGYAKMTQLLLSRMGIFCTLVNGTAIDTGSIDSDGTIYEPDGSWNLHVWNIVKVNGKYYNLDTTWGDATFSYDSENGEMTKGPDINYDYLLVPDSELTMTHRPDPVVEMPSCNSMDDNYYVQEGVFLSSVNESYLKDIFDNAYSNGELYVSIKCSDDSVYSDLINYFFKKEKVFNYLSGTSVKYIEYEKRRVVVIYL